jgi:type IV pilus biogenesis protein CpaD/CtpE
MSTLIAALLVGCATETPRLDAALGKSVEQMVRAQTLDPAASANPPALAPEVGDGQRLKNVLDVYRKEVTKGGEAVERGTQFEAGK